MFRSLYSAAASSSSLKFGIEFGHVRANTHLQNVQRERVKGQSKVYIYGQAIYFGQRSMLQGDVKYQQYKRYTSGSTDSLTEFKLGENYSSILSVRGSLIHMACNRVFD